MPRGQYGATIFDGNTNYLTLKISRQLQFITNSGRQHIAGTHFTQIISTTHRVYTFILTAIRYGMLQPVVPFIPHDTMYCRNRAGVHTGMTCCCNGWCIRHKCIFATKPGIQKPFKSSITLKERVKTVQIIPPHLVDYDTNHEPGTIYSGMDGCYGW